MSGWMGQAWMDKRKGTNLDREKGREWVSGSVHQDSELGRNCKALWITIVLPWHHVLPILTKFPPSSEPGILVPGQGSNSVVKGPSPHHRTAREFPRRVPLHFFFGSPLEEPNACIDFPMFSSSATFSSPFRDQLKGPLLLEIIISSSKVVAYFSLHINLLKKILNEHLTVYLTVHCFVPVAVNIGYHDVKSQTRLMLCVSFWK